MGLGGVGWFGRGGLGGGLVWVGRGRSTCFPRVFQSAHLGSSEILVFPGFPNAQLGALEHIIRFVVFSSLISPRATLSRSATKRSLQHTNRRHAHFEEAGPSSLPRPLSAIRLGDRPLKRRGRPNLLVEEAFADLKRQMGPGTEDRPARPSPPVPPVHSMVQLRPQG